MGDGRAYDRAPRKGNDGALERHYVGIGIEIGWDGIGEWDGLSGSLRRRKGRR